MTDEIRQKIEQIFEKQSITNEIINDESNFIVMDYQPITLYEWCMFSIENP